jgi:hypothetical protein
MYPPSSPRILHAIHVVIALVAVVLSFSLSGCAPLLIGAQGAGITAVHKVVKRAAYDLKGGERVADVTYRTQLSTVSEAVERECHRAPTWSEFEISCDPDDIATPQDFLLVMGDGSALATSRQGEETTLRASLKTRAIDTGRYGLQSAKSSGPSIPVFASVLRAVDSSLSRQGIKKIRGGFSSRIVHSARPTAVSSGPPAPSRDSTVREAQITLTRLGFDCGPPDGIWGDRTAGCVREFQRNRSLPVTGELDQNTLLLLQK